MRCLSILLFLLPLAQLAGQTTDQLETRIAELEREVASLREDNDNWYEAARRAEQQELATRRELAKTERLLTELRDSLLIVREKLARESRRSQQLEKAADDSSEYLREAQGAYREKIKELEANLGEQAQQLSTVRKARAEQAASLQQMRQRVNTLEEKSKRMERFGEWYDREFAFIEAETEQLLTQEALVEDPAVVDYWIGYLERYSSLADEHPEHASLLARTLLQLRAYRRIWYAMDKTKRVLSEDFNAARIQATVREMEEAETVGIVSNSIHVEKERLTELLQAYCQNYRLARAHFARLGQMPEGNDRREYLITLKRKGEFPKPEYKYLREQFEERLETPELISQPFKIVSCPG